MKLGITPARKPCINKKSVHALYIVILASHVTCTIHHIISVYIQYQNSMTPVTKRDFLNANGVDGRPSIGGAIRDEQRCIHKRHIGSHCEW